MEENVYSSEEQAWLADPSNNGRLTPSLINKLAPSEIFVFGSNVTGMHGGGAARVALDRFGAIWGHGEGLQGASYGIPTMEGIKSTSQAIARFITYASQHPEYIFLVTPVGCGIAGYKAEEIAPYFKDALQLENVYLPLSFYKVLTKA